jgi:hypothetical protein
LALAAGLQNSQTVVPKNAALSSRTNCSIAHMSHRIVFHIGAPKTGTSAIQRFLAANIAPLRAAGIDYLNGEQNRGYLHTTGNGMAIFLNAERAEPDRKQLQGVIASYLGSERTTIVSCELLYAISAPHWNEIIDACRAAGAAPSVIYYVRNVYPFYLSTYNQTVKHDRATESFEEFVTGNSVFSCRTVLDFFATSLGPDHLSVAHYDSHRDDLCRHFLGLLSASADPSDFAFDHARVNRSLDEGELRLMQIANRFPQAHFPGELSNLLIASDPDRATERPERPEIVALLTYRHGEDVAAINARYFGGEPLLQISSGNPADVASGTGAADAPAERLFEWAVAKLASSRHENFNELLAEARGLGARARRHPAISSDFDPAAYLLANPDLLLARVDPYKHFLNHGHKEGRTWRIDGSQSPAESGKRRSWVEQSIQSVAKLLGSPRAARSGRNENKSTSVETN